MGASVGILIVPSQISGKKLIPVIIIAAILGNLPDSNFPYWGHELYYFSHSLLVLSIVTALLIPVERLASFFREFSLGRLFLFNWLCILSHLGIDTLYNQGNGLNPFWPFSSLRIHFPIPLFHWASTNDWSTWNNMQEYLIEGGVFGLILLISILIKRLYVLKLSRP